MKFGTREQWRRRGGELRRQALRWDSGRGWALVAFGVLLLPGGLWSLVFASTAADRVASLLAMVAGVVVSLGLIRYLDHHVETAGRPLTEEERTLRYRSEIAVLAAMCAIAFAALIVAVAGRMR